MEILGPPKIHDALENHVVGFASTGGEDDFFGVGVQEACNFFSCLLDLLFCSGSEEITAGGIAEFLIHNVLHSRGCARIDRGGGVVIQIDEISHMDFPMSSIGRLLHPL